MKYSDIVKVYAKLEGVREEVYVHAMSYFNPFKEKGLIVSAICKYGVDLTCDYAYIDVGEGYKGFAPAADDPCYVFYSTNEDVLVYKVLQCILKSKGLWEYSDER